MFKLSKFDEENDIVFFICVLLSDCENIGCIYLGTNESLYVVDGDVPNL